MQKEWNLARGQAGGVGGDEKESGGQGRGLQGKKGESRAGESAVL